MSAGKVFCLVMIFSGVLTLWMTLVSLAKRKFTDGICMLWGILSVCMILAGLLLDPVGISGFISNTGLVIGCVAGLGVLFMAWCFSREISDLTRKNYELAMQLSLLNQEHDQIQKLLEELTQKQSEELWR